MTASLPSRADIPADFKWNIEKLFSAPADWDAEYAALERDLASLAEFRGRLSAPGEVAAYFARAKRSRRACLASATTRS